MAVFSQAMLTLIHEGMEAQPSRNGRELLVEFVRGSGEQSRAAGIRDAHHGSGLAPD